MSSVQVCAKIYCTADKDFLCAPQEVSCHTDFFLIQFDLCFFTGKVCKTHDLLLLQAAMIFGRFFF